MIHGVNLYSAHIALRIGCTLLLLAGGHPILSECERQRMFVRYSHPNVSTFSGSMSRMAAPFSANVSG